MTSLLLLAGRTVVAKLAEWFIGVDQNSRKTSTFHSKKNDKGFSTEWVAHGPYLDPIFIVK